MPSDHLVACGKDATLLIHEATFAEDDIEEAKAKKHSTIQDALDVARK